MHLDFCKIQAASMTRLVERFMHVTASYLNPAWAKDNEPSLPKP